MDPVLVFGLKHPSNFNRSEVENAIEHKYRQLRQKISCRLKQKLYKHLRWVIATWSLCLLAAFITVGYMLWPYTQEFGRAVVCIVGLAAYLWLRGTIAMHLKFATYAESKHAFMFERHYDVVDYEFREYFPPLPGIDNPEGAHKDE